MAVKLQFSIKDLEHLTGVKAHTIRIWEKRYNLLSPQRTDTNIRTYNIESLKKLLNITLLYNNGLKISKIASRSEDEIHRLVQEAAADNIEKFTINSFKTSMYQLDEQLFIKTYVELELHKTFREIFLNIFMPFLMEIGTLWATSSIRTSHESFISELLKRKILLNIEKEVHKAKDHEKPLFVLFLPYQEIHELGILYTNYEILKAGYRTIYLGTNTPLDSLNGLITADSDIIYVSYLTMRPEGKDIHEYINIFQDTISNDKKSNLWLLGKRSEVSDLNKIPSNISIVQGFPELIDRLERLKDTP
ncbi:MAG: DNA-binding transcriptional MerR regulator [Sediminicola sp.]|jgi:DNA-binding transcriptional MerR regulator|tara:strand:+ start:990 stop:1904 length:915 start_codon:yes stop_codon:yes gene_type:complete